MLERSSLTPDEMARLVEAKLDWRQFAGLSFEVATFNFAVTPDNKVVLQVNVVLPEGLLVIQDQIQRPRLILVGNRPAVDPPKVALPVGVRLVVDQTSLTEATRAALESKLAESFPQTDAIVPPSHDIAGPPRTPRT